MGNGDALVAGIRRARAASGSGLDCLICDEREDVQRLSVVCRISQVGGGDGVFCYLDILRFSFLRTGGGGCANMMSCVASTAFGDSSVSIDCLPAACLLAHDLTLPAHSRE